MEWNIFRRKEKPQERFAGETYEAAVRDFGTSVGYATSYYGGWMQIPAVDRAVSLFTDQLGACGWDAYQTVKGVEQKVTPRPSLLEQPNPEETPSSTRSALIQDYILHGNAIEIIATRNAYGVPTSTVPVPAEWVGIRRITKPGEWLPIGAIEYDVMGHKYSQYEVIHYKNNCRPGDIKGVGVMEKHFNSYKLAAEQIRQAGNLAKSSMPTLTYKLAKANPTPTDMQAVKGTLMSSQRDRQPLVIPSQDELIPVSWNPTEMQMIEARKFSLLDWSNVFGLPPAYLGADTSSKTYTNIQQEALHFAKHSLNGIKQRFEETLSLAFPRGTVVRADLTTLLRTDDKTMFETYKLAVEAGLITLKEARKAMGYGDMPEQEGTQNANEQQGNTSKEPASPNSDSAEVQ